jgi:hypothetical protein
MTDNESDDDDVLIPQRPAHASRVQIQYSSTALILLGSTTIAMMTMTTILIMLLSLLFSSCLISAAAVDVASAPCCANGADAVADRWSNGNSIMDSTTTNDNNTIITITVIMLGNKLVDS